MTLVTPIERSAVPALEPLFQAVEGTMGYVPQSFLTMARWPELLQHFSGLAGTVLGSGEVDPGLKQLLAYAVSLTAGCRYCQAHTSHNATHRGVSEEKLNAMPYYDSSDLFSDAERAAICVAMSAGTLPNSVTPEQMKQLSAYFSERQCVEIVAVIAVFGFLNRWNETMATTLEDIPKAFADSALTPQGWDPGRHV